jgi:hypothetical protein
MNEITVVLHKVNESVVEQRQSDGYINATALSKAHGLTTGKRRDVSEWLENKRTKETLSHLSSKTGIPVFELYQVFQGSPENGGGTWIHPKLAVRFGIWLSDEFGYLVEQWVEEWLTGGKSAALNYRVVELENKLEIAMEAIASLQSQLQRLLPPSADYMPPGWNPEVWQSLPPQDKQHFRFLYHQHGFIPSDQEIDPLEIPLFTTEQIKQQQRDEFLQLVGEVSQEELERMEAIKREILQQFLAQEG